MKPHESIILEITRERERQITEEGWSRQHDNLHTSGEMAVAAGMYAINAGDPTRLEIVDHFGPNELYPLGWPWHRQWWKPKDPRRDLIRAAALIVAEIERLERASTANKGR